VSTVASGAALPENKSLPIGLSVSIGLHVLLAAYLLVSFSHPQPLAPPADLSNAIAISMEPFRPKPPPKPPTPKPKTPEEVVTTTAPEPDTVVAEKPEDSSPPAPQEPATGTPSAASYASIVAGIIQRNKRYPREALLAETEGVVEAFFVVNRQGHVIGYRILKSSGQRVLDQEVVRLLRHVSFPPIPNDGGDPERREFSLPIAFRIRE
jgi:periplasmic protein TonB